MARLGLSIYLIKESVVDVHAAINFDGLDRSMSIRLGVDAEGQPRLGTLRYGSRSSAPDWLAQMRSQSVDESHPIVMASSVTGVLVAQLDRTFAVVFGHGWQRIGRSIIEPNFGIRCVLNLSGRNALKGIRRDRVAEQALQAIEQIPDEDGIGRFGLDQDQDLLKAVRANVTRHATLGSFGSVVSGSDAFNVEMDLATESLESLLDRCLQLYAQVDYRKNFPWVDQIEAVKDQSVISALKQQLVIELSKSTKGFTLCVPDVLSWEDFDVLTFVRAKRNSAPTSMQFDIATWIAQLRWSFDLSDLEKTSVYAYSQASPGIKKSWSIYECLHGLVELDGEKYLAHGGHWYKIDKEFIKRVEKAVGKIPDSAVKTSKVGLKEKEGEYNARVASDNSLGFQLLDQKLIHHGGGQSKFELCDLLTLNAELICVKTWGGNAASLSHLFQQALAACQLIAEDAEFVKKAKKKIASTHGLAWDQVCDLKTPTKVVLAVLRGPKKADLPLFAKIGLARAVSQLRLMRFEAEYLQIPP